MKSTVAVVQIGLCSLLAIGSLACAGLFAESEDDAMRIICDAPTTCPDCLTGPPHAQSAKLIGHIKTKITRSETLAWLGELAVLNAAERNAKLAAKFETVNAARPPEEAQDACSLVDHLQSIVVEDLGKQMEEMCAIPATCSSFVADKPSTLLQCLSEGDFSDKLKDPIKKKLGNRAQLGEAVLTLSKQNKQLGCALATQLLNP